MEKCYLFVFAVFFSITCKTQDSLIRCNTAVDLNWMQTNAPDRYQRFIDLETFTNNYISNLNQAGGRLINGNGLIVIPVVIHILHYGEPEGTGYNISMATIQSQIDVLNEDFRRLNADAINTPSVFQPFASNFNIEFRLACIDPNGNSTNGVVRKQTSVSPFVTVTVPNDNTFDETAMGIKTLPNGSVAWPTDHYLNIWVCKLYRLAGYATFPADYAVYPEFDGVVIGKEAFGRNGGTTSGLDKGRTATHEIGHWLNLQHLWGNTIGPQYNYDCSNDDLVGDTPQQKTNNSGCPTFPEILRKCNSADPSSMFMNYMDYVNDGCYNLFTNGQKLRARALFATGGPRAAMLDNYFKIQQPANPLQCNGGVIKLFNPNCITPTWSVVSGPATITAGQNTNACTLLPNGTGTVVLRATAGNYIDEKNISVNTTLPTVSISGPESVCKNQPSVFSIDLPYNASATWNTAPYLPIVPTSPNTVMVMPNNTPASSYILNANVGMCNTVVQSQKNVAFNTAALPYTCTDVGNGACTVQVPRCISQYNAESGYFLPNPFLPGVVQWKWEATGGKFRNGTTVLYTTPSSSPEYVTPDYGSGACVVYIRPVNNCGIVTTEGEPFKYIITNTGQPCYNYRYIVTPNPATSIITVNTDIATVNKAERNEMETGFTSIEIRNKMGNMMRKLNYMKGTVTGTIDISALPADVYLIRIYNGAAIEDHKVIVTK